MVALIAGMAFPMPGGLPVVAAADPTAEPTPAPSPDATPLPSPTPEASSSPSPVESASPDSSPTPAASTLAPSASGDALPSPASLLPVPSTAATGEPSPLISPTTSPAAEPLLRYRLSPAQQSGTTVTTPIPLYRLVLPPAAATASPDSPHVVSGLSGEDCATCHASHTAQGGNLLVAAPQTSLCYQCHGNGAALDAESDFAGLPGNDPANDAVYSHRAACAECHNPHATTPDRPQQSSTGWTASGGIRSASGVAVTNGAAGSAPGYRLIRTGGGLTYEYELCLTCHAGQGAQPVANASHPSWWALDKGIELNPANDSFHPIEAAGRNQTAQMAASLSGTSPFKAWSYSIDATIRCTSCHGDPSTVSQPGAPIPVQPSADAAEASHGSPNRGLLIAPYRDRALKPAGEAYNAADFALCYLCHAERPFVDPNADSQAPDTLFPYHGRHLTLYAGSGGAGLSIDTPGDGAGFATCAECHFRIHSTAIAYATGDLAPTARSTGGTSLVGFAPDVTGSAGLGPAWNTPGADGVGSCTLTCHGHEHTASSTYTAAPGAGFSADRTSGAIGLQVHFTDATRYAVPGDATWAWDFGDGTTSADQDPVHTYTTAGTYTVTLTVTRTVDSLSSTLTRSDYIVVTP